MNLVYIKLKGGYGNMNYKTLNLTSLNEKETIYCLGFFDGLHLGHQELIKETKILAKKLNKKVGILTFSTFISTKIEKHNDSKLLMSNDKKNELLKSFDLDVITYLDFDNECKNTSKEDFIKFLKENLTVLV